MAMGKGLASIVSIFEDGLRPRLPDYLDHDSPRSSVEIRVPSAGEKAAKNQKHAAASTYLLSRSKGVFPFHQKRGQKETGRKEFRKRA